MLSVRIMKSMKIVSSYGPKRTKRTHAAALVTAGADLTTQIPLNAAAVAQVLASANLSGGVSTIKPNPLYTATGLWRDYRVAA